MSGYSLLTFDSNSGRMTIGDHDLHCGECFQVQVNGQWLDVRIEHCSAEQDNGWFIIGAPWRDFPNSPSIEGLPARLYS